MDLRTLRARCAARLADAPFPRPFDARAFCEALAARRCRPIVLRPFVGAARPCGLWVASAAADYIFYEQETSPLHRQHIIVHEASHLLCGHRGLELDDDELAGLLFPSLRPETVRTVLPRAAYALEEEREAELLASLILERAAAEAGTDPVEPDPDGVVARLRASLEGDGPA
jgi:hypothetical protein